MRSILVIVLLLSGVGLLSCRLEGRSANVVDAANASDWVRTIDGWERPLNWSSSLAKPPAVHPLVVAAGQMLISLFALAIATGPADRKSPGE